MQKYFFLVATFALMSCAMNTDTPDTGIKHIVLCWLNKPGNQQDIRQVIKTSNELTVIPGVLDLKAGIALESDREIVDDSYDVGIVMTFNNTDEMMAYLNHPEHVSRVKNVLAPLCRRIQVYDIIY